MAPVENEFDTPGLKGVTGIVTYISRELNQPLRMTNEANGGLDGMYQG